MSQWDFGYGREPREDPEPHAQDGSYPYPGVSYSTGLPYDVRRPADPGQPADAGWPATSGEPGDTYPGAVYPADEVYDPPPEYPITYERDAFEGRFAVPAGPAPDAAPPYPPWPPAAAPTDRFTIDPADRLGADRFGGDRFESEAPVGRWRPPPTPGRAWETADRDRAQQEPGRGRHQARRASPAGENGLWHGRRPDRGRWLAPAAVAVGGAAVGVAIVAFALGQSRATTGTTAPGTGARSSAGVAGAGAPVGVSSPGAGAGASAVASAPAGASAGSSGGGSAPLTLAAARTVLSAYTAANNNANAKRNTATLAMIETGGSYAIDAGLYTVQGAAKSAPYPAFAPATAAYYIPQSEPAGGTRWFVVQVANAFSSDPKKVTSTEYLLFTQAASGAWQNAIEPYLLTGADAPQISVAANGLATAVSPTSTSLALAPGQLAQRTAAALDNADAGASVAASDPSALADRSEQAFWRAKLPTATVTDTHAAATGPAGQTFALRTANGGALVFYTDAADLTITAPAGSTIRLKVPGLYSPSQPVSQAGLAYLDQFAALDPPAGAGPPTVIAQYSGITGKA